MGFIVRCTLPNASENISGVAFTRQDDGSMATVEVESEVAGKFRGIKGYTIEDPSVDAARLAILAEADRMGFKLDGRLGTEKLGQALDAAKAKAAADKAAADQAASDQAAADKKAADDQAAADKKAADDKAAADAKAAADKAAADAKAAADKAAADKKA